MLRQNIEELDKEPFQSSHLLQERLIAFPMLFAEQVNKTPNNTAIIFEGREYTYQQLDHLSDTFKQAVLLHSNASYKSDGTDVSIGICIDKSPEAIAAMLGILKAGAAFVPLDPELPVDRIAYMVTDANISTIFIQPNHQEKIAPSIQKILLDDADSEVPTIHWINCFQPLVEDDTSLISVKGQVVEIDPTDLAYIMYTSGSTGKPKGVQIEHIALATYCYADVDVYKVNEFDRTLQFSTINFDIAIEEIFPPLLTGSCIVIRPSAYSDKLNELSAIINDYQVTAVHIATAYWHEWVDLMQAAGDLIPESLRLMVVTGEKVSTKHYQRWKQLSNPNAENDVLWCNAYGPTEATVSASVFIPDVNFNEDNMPIGKPLKRYTSMIVDEDFNDLPEGETGQLLIGGPALARGYLNRPELNSDVFIELEEKNNSNTVVRMYKTGDLARWLPDGNIEFAGRIDHQIKLGSYRIEPGEIEVAINEHQTVLESLVSYDEVDGKKTLIAYIAIGENSLDSSAVIADMWAYLQQNLPAYMVPSRYILLENFPKTNNGKVDRKNLPDPSSSIVPRSSHFVAPRDELEQELVKMWQEVLQLPEVSIHDDFFALGGSSLLAVGVVSRIVQHLDLELPVRDFFANPTIASQAKHIKQMQGLVDDELINTDSVELRKRLPIIDTNFFNSGHNRLFGVHYRPPEFQPSLSHAVLICHPLGHEYPRSYRNLQQFSLHLAQAGFDAFRFDYAGTGNSSGESATLTAEQCISDIKAAASRIIETSDCNHLSIIAVRMGAPLVINAIIDEFESKGQKEEIGSSFKNLENVILWDPVVDGSEYLSLLDRFHRKTLNGLEAFRQIRKRSLLKQLFGHAFTSEKYGSLEKLKIPKTIPEYIKSDSDVRVSVVTSSNYATDELDFNHLKGHWKITETEDSIFWHAHKYTNSAFSSPEAFKEMMSILKETR